MKERFPQSDVISGVAFSDVEEFILSRSIGRRVSLTFSRFLFSGNFQFSLIKIFFYPGGLLLKGIKRVTKRRNQK